MQRIPSAAVLAGIALCAVFLVGCSSPTTAKPVPSPSVLPAATTPHSGDCWNAPSASASVWNYWQGAARSDCSTAHDLYTFDVVRLRGSLPDDWAVSSSNHDVDSIVQAASKTACGLPFKKFFSSRRWNQQILLPFYFIPTRAQWRSGARWVRCDLAIASFGSRLGEPKLAALPSRIQSLIDDLQSDPKKYEYCVTTKYALNSGPLDDPEAVYADCRGQHQWALLRHATIPGKSSAGYPSGAIIKRVIAATCKGHLPNGEVYVAYYPQPGEWAYGYHDVTCWYAQGPKKPASGGGLV